MFFTSNKKNCRRKLVDLFLSLFTVLFCFQLTSHPYNFPKPQYFKKAAEHNPRSQAWISLASLYINQQKIEQAVKILLEQKRVGIYNKTIDLLIMKVLEVAPDKSKELKLSKELLKDLREELETGAAKGDIHDSYLLSVALESGFLGEVDITRSEKLLLYSAKEGHCCANAKLAKERICKAKPSQEDIQFAYSRLKMAQKAAPTCPNVLSLLGIGAVMGLWENRNEGEKYLLASLNVPESAWLLGILCMEKNRYKDAIHYYKIAKRKPSLKESVEVMILFAQIDSAIDAKDTSALQRIFSELKKYADDGNFFAWNYVAICYAAGIGVKRDAENAEYWKKKILAKELDPRNNLRLMRKAKKNLSDTVDKLNRNFKQHELEKKEFMEQYKRALDQNKKEVKKAQHNLLLQNFIEIQEKSLADFPPLTKEEEVCSVLIVMKKIEEAEKQSLKINAKHPRIALALGYAYLSGQGVKPDISKAKAYFLRCQTLPTGQFGMGKVYEREQEYSKALDCYSKASKDGLKFAAAHWHYCEGKKALQTGDFKRAVISYEKAYHDGLTSVAAELDQIKMMAE